MSFKSPQNVLKYELLKFNSSFFLTSIKMSLKITKLSLNLQRNSSNFWKFILYNNNPMFSSKFPENIPKISLKSLQKIYRNFNKISSKLQFLHITLPRFSPKLLKHFGQFFLTFAENILITTQSLPKPFSKLFLTFHRHFPKI